MNGPLRRGLRALLLIAAYVACCAYSEWLAPPEGVAVFWPASGVALAAVLRYGLRWAAIVPLALLIVHATFSPVPAAFLPYSLAANFSAVLVGGMLGRLEGLTDSLPVQTGFRVLLAGMAMALTGAVIGGIGLGQAGMLGGPPVEAMLRWGLGDLLGATAVAPAILFWLAPRREASPLPEYGSDGERQLWTICLFASFLLLAWGASVSDAYPLGLSSLPLSVMLWSAMRFSPLRTAVSVLLTTLLLSALVGLNVGGFRVPARTLEVAILLVYLCMLAILPMLLVLAVEERRRTGRHLRELATTDVLTGLPNRLRFESQANAALDDPAQPPMALAYLDLDNLKLVNDTASHVAGDALIRTVATELAARMQRGDLLGHYGGDEFVMLLRNCSATVARERAQALLHAVEDCTCVYHEQPLRTTASIGLVPFQPDEVSLAEALSQADAACFSAKEDGGNRVRVAGARSGTLTDPTSSMRWAVSIRRALVDDGFLLYAQSIAPLSSTLETGRHFELLLRMRASHGAPHMPDTFLPAAERFRLGVQIDRAVVNSALSWLETHPDAAAGVGTCAINLGGSALADEGFIGFLVQRLRRSSVPATRLCFEITETSAVRDLVRAQRFIGEMRALGCRFALDDFGTGFCSFGYVRQLDVDYFKIDGSFVREMDTSPVALEVVRSITRIAHVLEKHTIAEHTETLQQRDALRELGVDYAQGYAIDRPQPLAQYLAAA